MSLVSKNSGQLKEASVGYPKDSILLIILVLFFFSGAAALIYEVVWMRMLTLVFGATAFATSTILASFFAGLALGSFYFGRVIDKGRNPLKVYALLEVGIGIFAFLMPLIFSSLDTIYISISQHFQISFYPISLIRFVLSFSVLLIPATLMGGTFPVISKFLIRRRERLGRNIGNLYSINTFGAVVGSLSAGFLLIMIWGVKESAYIAGVVNLLIAGTILVLNWRVGNNSVADSDLKKNKREREEGGGGEYSEKVARLTLWVAGVSGFCALAYEVFWTRALVFFLDNTIHAFTTMLTTFLFGIAAGSFVVARFIDTRKKLLVWLGLVEMLIGLFAILTIVVFDNLGVTAGNIVGVYDGSMTYWKWTGIKFIRSFLIILIPTFLMGMTFPLVSKIYTTNLRGVGKAIGNVYSANTVGGIFGSVIAGFVLVPFIGVQHSIILIAFINVVVGGILVLYEPLMKYRNKLKTVVVMGLLFVGGAIFLTTSGITFTSDVERIESDEVLYYREGIGATAKVFRDKRGDKQLSIDGFPVAGTSLAAHDIQKALGNIPLLLNNVPSPRVMILGFGAGGTTWGVMQYNVEEVDVVELVPAVIDAAKWFPAINHGVLDDPKLNLIMGDGRNHLLVTNKKYDVISVDATSPIHAGNGSLYTLEFYELTKERLSQGGLVVQWLPIHLLSEEEVRMTVKTFQMVFPHTTLWFTPVRGYAILVGKQEKLEIDFKSLSSKFDIQNIKQELKWVNVYDSVDFLSSFIMGEKSLSKYVGDAKINTDDHPYLEFTQSTAYLVPTQYYVQNMLSMDEFRESVFPLLVNIGETDAEIATVKEQLMGRFEATQYRAIGDLLIAAHYNFLLSYIEAGMYEEARAELIAFSKIAPLSYLAGANDIEAMLYDLEKNSDLE
ncbi:fused MFS/spermidine synthase [Chloroflexota bacterium]